MKKNSQILNLNPIYTWIIKKIKFDFFLNVNENILQSINIMADSSKSFAIYCVKGIKADKEKIKKFLDNSLMLVTALSPVVGYDNAAKIAKKAHKNGTTLKEEALKSGLISKKDYEKIVDPKKMIKPY